MKYIYLILLGLLALTPATYAEDNGNADQMSMTQPGNITVKGKIVDENGNPLPGATILQKGTTNGATSDLDGNFSLTVPSDATLAISFVGYTSIEVTCWRKNGTRQYLNDSGYKNTRPGGSNRLRYTEKG